MSGNASSRYRWLVLAITTVGVLMVAIDTTVVILALPPIIQDLHSNLVNAIWVIMSYIFVTTVLLLALGRVADLYGRVRLYNLGFAIFTIGSALCGFSRTDWELIGSRVIQGVGGALMLVNAWAILTETFPPGQRGPGAGDQFDDLRRRRHYRAGIGRRHPGHRELALGLFHQSPHRPVRHLFCLSLSA